MKGLKEAHAETEDESERGIDEEVRKDGRRKGQMQVNREH